MKGKIISFIILAGLVGTGYFFNQAFLVRNSDDDIQYASKKTKEFNFNLYEPADYREPASIKHNPNENIKKQPPKVASKENKPDEKDFWGYLKSLNAKKKKDKKKKKKKKTKKDKDKDKDKKEEIAEYLDDEDDYLEEESKNILSNALAIYQNQSGLAPGNSSASGTSKNDPIARQYTPVPDVTEENDYSVAVWTNQNYFLIQENPVELFLEVSSKDVKVPIISAEATIYNSKHVAYKTIKYVATSEKTYSYKATLPVSESATEDIQGNYYAKITITTKDNQTIHKFDSFSLQYRKASFVKNHISSRLSRNKDLSFRVKYKVYQSGQYIVMGTLYNSDNQLVAIKESPVKLSRGSRWVDFDFHGFKFYNEKRSGPFKLKNITLSYVKPNLSTVNEEYITVNHITSDYKWDEFNPIPYTDAYAKEKASLIENYLKLNQF